MNESSEAEAGAEGRDGQPSPSVDPATNGVPRLPDAPSLPPATDASAVSPASESFAPPGAAETVLPDPAADEPLAATSDGPTAYAEVMAPMAGMTGSIAEPAGFAPLRSDSPPSLLPTWWLRSAMLVVMLAAVVVTLWTEFYGEPGDIGSSSLVIGIHVFAGVLLLLWSLLALGNAGRLVPPSLYQSSASGWVAVLLWLVAAAAPYGAYLAYRRLDDRLDDPDDLTAVFVMIAVVLVAFLAIWMPFRYMSRQGARVGAPSRAMHAWFYAPLICAVGGVLSVAIGLRELLEADGLEDSERLVQVGVAYGLPMFVFALATWRAVTVFDEVIDLRWRRWRTEWEQTLDAMADQPPPGPEDSPDVGPAESVS